MLSAYSLASGCPMLTVDLSSPAMCKGIDTATDSLVLISMSALYFTQGVSSGKDS
jgi:hypothetical protein